jgi:hypothetical protein
MSIPAWLERLRTAWANLHPFKRFCVLAALLAAFWLVALVPGYRTFKSWRRERNLETAASALKQQRMQQARDLSLSVLSAGDSRIDAIRILEQATACLQDPRHSEVARALIGHAEASDADRLRAFAGIAADMPLAWVGQAWMQLPGHCREDTRFALPFADRLIDGKRYREAAGVLLAIPQSRGDVALERKLIRVLIASGARDAVTEAQKRIAAHPPGEDMADVSAWCDLIESIPMEWLDGALLGPARAWLENTADSGDPRLRLLLARLTIATSGGHRDEILRDAINREKSRAPEALAGLLIAAGRPEWVLDEFGGGGFSAPVARLTIKAAMAAREWKRLVEILDQKEHGLPKFEKLAYLAVAAAKTGNTADRVRLWNEALLEARGSLRNDAFLWLHRLAMEQGLADEAEQALLQAIRSARGPLPLYAEIAPLVAGLARRGRENLLLEVCGVYASLEPSNPVLLTQYAYLALLHNLVEPDRILVVIQILAKAFPDQVPIQSVLAAIHLAAGRPEMAAKTLDPLKLDPARLSLADRAIFLITQVRNGRLAKDDPAVKDFPWKDLQISERKTFTSWLQEE